jgi:group I intron endonuclease
MGKQRFGCIYRFTNTVTGKKYIGRTLNFKQRMAQHKRDNRKTYLKNSINKHGWEIFKKEILIDNVPEKDLNNLEMYYIEVENTMAPNGYNLTKGGEGSIGYKHDIKSRKKMCIQQKIRQCNRGKIGCVSYFKPKNRWRALGPLLNKKVVTIGYYYTKEKAERALALYIKDPTHKLFSDNKTRRKGTGNIRKISNKSYRARITIKKKTYRKCFCTIQECEEYLDNLKKGAKYDV